MALTSSGRRYSRSFEDDFLGGGKLGETIAAHIRRFLPAHVA
jgi:hypothetical protein